jgi:hypothetical protein
VTSSSEYVSNKDDATDFFADQSLPPDVSLLWIPVRIPQVIETARNLLTTRKMSIFLDRYMACNRVITMTNIIFQYSLMSTLAVE